MIRICPQYEADISEADIVDGNRKACDFRLADADCVEAAFSADPMRVDKQTFL